MPELPDVATLGEGLAFFHWVTHRVPHVPFLRFQNHRGLLALWRYWPETHR
jgi:hypothetical protein